MIATRGDLGRVDRIVTKVGSSSISGENAGRIGDLVDALADIHSRGAHPLLVSSGAISTGRPFLDLDDPEDDLATQQAAAAVGQNLLVHRYQASLDRYGIVAGQVLLTANDLDNPSHKANAKRAIERLLDLRILPIVNENDTVATHEIRFGDNDRLAALVAVLVGADALILLSDVDALYTRPPHQPGAERIPFVAANDPLEGIEVATARTDVGTGGAVTKVAAARLAVNSGVGVLLTSATLVREALAGADVGTWFEPTEPVTTGSFGVPDAQAGAR